MERKKEHLVRYESANKGYNFKNRLSAGQSIAYALTSFKQLDINYTENNGTMLPGILSSPNFYGYGQGIGGPTFGFLLGSHADIRRAAIENGWDDPSKGQVTIGGSMTIMTNGHSASPSVVSVNGDDKRATNVNSTGASGPSSVHVPNGPNGATPASSAAEEARIALLSALGKCPKAPSRDLSRKQFVQEVLSLIYVRNLHTLMFFHNLTPALVV